VREITRKIDEQINSVRRELSNLLSIGIISSDTNNNRLYYEVNQKYEYYKPLLEIFGQTTALKLPAEGEEPVTSDDDRTHDLRMLGNVELALYTGQFTRDNQSGVDLLIVGDINQTKLTKFVADLEKTENKVLRYAVFTVRDFTYRLQVKDRFLSNIMSSKKQVLIDKNGVFAKE
jgi:hypothetical protein